MKISRLQIIFLILTIFLLIEIKYNLFLINYTNFGFKLPCEPTFKTNNQFYVNIDGEIYPKIIRLANNKSINFKCLQKNKKSKIILLWNLFGDIYRYPNGNTEFINNGCPVTNCHITDKKSMIAIADFVVIHIPSKFEPLPSSRPKNQRVIFMSYESPVNHPLRKGYSHYFNLTSTYSYDSDFPAGQLNMVWQKNPEFNPNKNYLLGKTELATAIISNCNSKSKRLVYIKEMKKLMKVDVYGRCGEPCEHVECKLDLSVRYMFYLAFENSFCKNYITEKFWDTLKFDLIPVVMGKGKYNQYVSIFKINLQCNLLIGTEIKD